jgi:hypothetical protein
MTQDGGVFKRADLWYPSEAYAKAAELADLNVPNGEFTDKQWEQMKPFLRPVMVSLQNCKKIDICCQATQSVVFYNVSLRRPIQ